MDSNAVQSLKRKLETYHHYGMRTVRVELEDEVGGMFVGSYTIAGTKQECRFIKRPATDQWKQDFDNCLLLSNKVHSIIVIPPTLGSTFDGNFVLLGYKFDETFNEFKASGKIPEAISVPNGILCSFWIDNTGNLLCGIRSMHYANVFHGSLDKDESYVVRNGLLYIINARIDGNLLNPIQRRQQREKDIHDFKTFFQRNTASAYESSDRGSFINLLYEQPDNDIVVYLNHPLLKNSKNRLRYFHQAYDCIGQERYKKHPRHPFLRQTLNLWRDLDQETRCVFNNWKLLIEENTLLDKILKQTPDYVSPYNDSSSDLLRFIIHSKKHSDVEEEKLEREVEKVFPGYLGRIHCLSATSKYLPICLANEYMLATNMHYQSD